MEIRLFTATPAEAAKTATDVDTGTQTPDGSFEDLLSTVSTVNEGETVKGDGKVIPIEVPAIEVSAASESKIVEGGPVPSALIVETALQGVNLGIKDVKTAEEESKPVDTEADAGCAIVAAPVEIPLQPSQDNVSVEDGHANAGEIAISIETGTAEAPAPSISADNGAAGETTAEAEEVAGLSSKEDVKEIIGSIERENATEVSGFTVNQASVPYATDQRASAATEAAPDASINALTSENASASQAVGYVSRETAEKEDGTGSVEAYEAESSEAEPSGSNDGARNEAGVSSNRMFDMNGGQDNGGDKGTGAERAIDVKSEGEVSTDENGNETFGVEYAESAGAPSNGFSDMTLQDDHAAVGTAQSFGVDRPAEAPAASDNADRGSETDTDLFEKLDTGVKMSVQGNGSVRLELSPEHLGDLEIKLKIEDTRVAAEIRVESAEVKALLDADSGRLKEIFSSNGLTLDKYTVEVDMNSMRGKTESNGNFSNCFQENASGRNGYGRKPWTGEAEVETAFGNRYESTGKKGGIDIFA
ncbi:MAG: flagellar hook-length control protein FliK [Deltaproteobacteria bacterium]|nr:flagellar hook-length control protein FliK [Deltaproteobacteria bacterium]